MSGAEIVSKMMKWGCGLVAWIQRSPVLRWWLRFCAWGFAIVACWLLADVGFEIITGDSWDKRSAGNHQSVGERLFQSLVFSIGAVSLYRITGLRSLALRDVLAFSAALAISIAFHHYCERFSGDRLLHDVGGQLGQLLQSSNNRTIANRTCTRSGILNSITATVARPLPLTPTIRALSQRKCSSHVCRRG